MVSGRNKKLAGGLLVKRRGPRGTGEEAPRPAEGITKDQIPDDHQPLLKWVVANWDVVSPRLAVVRADPRTFVILIDVRVQRGASVYTLEASSVFDQLKVVELASVSSALADSHTFAFSHRWAKRFSTHLKEHAKTVDRKHGCACLFVIGDTKDDPEAELNDPNVFIYHVENLRAIANKYRREFEVRREVERRKLELAPAVLAANPAGSGQHGGEAAPAERSLEVSRDGMRVADLDDAQGNLGGMKEGEDDDEEDWIERAGNQFLYYAVRALFAVLLAALCHGALWPAVPNGDAPPSVTDSSFGVL